MASEIITTVKPSGGDYTSLSNWEAGQQGDLPTLDEIHTAECYSMADATAIIIDGWTTDATRYIKIYTPIAERHDGKWDTSAYRLTLAGGFIYLLNILEDYVRIEGIQIYNTETANSPGAITYTGGGELQISYCVIRGSITAGGRHLINLGPAVNSSIKIWNNVLYDANGGGILYYFGNTGQTIVIYNNTVVDSDSDGIRIQAGVGDVSLYFKNNVVQGASTNYIITSFTILSTANNLSEDATSPNAAYRNKVVIFENEGSDDFHLGSGDTEAKNKGTNLSTDPDGQLSFSDDIDGDSRPQGIAWDMGADEIVGVGIFPDMWHPKIEQPYPYKQEVVSY